MHARAAAQLLVAFAVVFGAGFIVSLPPFGWGDEVPHDLRALRTSEGSLLPHMKGGVRGALVDPRLRRTLVATAFTTEAMHRPIQVQRS